MNDFLSRPHAIAAILPSYTDAGDVSLIISADGRSRTVPVKVRTVIKRLASYYAADLTALKRHTGKLTERAILQPLPFTPGLVLCPVKVRRPKVLGDSSIGYINLHSVAKVDKINKPPYQAAIFLAGDTQVHALWSVPTVNKHLSCARLAAAYCPAQRRPMAAENPALYGELAPLIQRFAELLYAAIKIKSP